MAKTIIHTGSRGGGKTLLQKAKERTAMEKAQREAKKLPPKPRKPFPLKQPTYFDATDERKATGVPGISKSKTETFTFHLDPCPFCGLPNTPRMVDDFREYKFVRCEAAKCRSAGPRRDTMKEAADAWNNRAKVPVARK